MPTLFARRLNELMAQRSHTTGTPLTNRALAHGLADAGHSVSVPYLSQLRRGRRNSPSPGLITAFAQFFEVDVDFFYYEAMPNRPRNIELIATLHQPDLRRLLAAAEGLSPASIRFLGRLVTSLRTAESRPPDRDTATF